MPEHVREHVDYITPGIKLFSSSKKPARKDDGSELQKRTFGVTSPGASLPPLPAPLPGLLTELLQLPLSSLCDVAATPACIRTLYNITKGTTATPGNQLGIFEDLGDVYSQTDLDLFFTTLTS